MLEDNILQTLFEERITTALEATLRTDKVYKESSEHIKKTFQKLEKLDLSKKQTLIIDRVISAINADDALMAGRLTDRASM